MFIKLMEVFPIHVHCESLTRREYILSAPTKTFKIVCYLCDMREKQTCKLTWGLYMNKDDVVSAANHYIHT